MGRQRELELLHAAIEAAVGGRGSVWLVCGEPGIGKSHLFEALERRARADGVAVHWGRSWEAGGAPAFWPWIQVLRSILADIRGIETVSPASLPLLAQLLPELAGGPAADGGTALEPEQARFALMDAVTGVLHAASSAAPVLVLLEDLHAADPASVTLLDFVSRQVDPHRLLIAGNYREAEAARQSVGRDLAALAARTRTLRLGRLEAGDVVSCIRRQIGREPAPRVASAIHEATDGNPLFVVEIAALMNARGQLEDGGELIDILVPESVSAVIRERAAELEPTTRRRLETASIVGREFRGAEVATLCDASGEDLGRSFDEALTAGILERVGTDRWRFSHIVTREVFHAALDAGSRRQLHLLHADMLESRGDAGLAPPWSEIAHHLLEAGREDDSRAVVACIRAAEQARSRYAFDDAAEVLARALEVLGRFDDSDERRRCELMVERARSLLDGGRIDSGRKLCAEAADAARALGDAALLARAALIYGSVFSIAEIDPVLVGLLREALQALEVGDSPDRARLQARLAAALQPAADPEEPMELAREAIDMARRTGDRRALLETIRSGCSALMDLAEPDERLRFNREHVALAEALDAPIEALRGHMRAAIDCLDLGDVAGCDSAIAAYVALASQTGLPHHLWPAASLRAMRAMMNGRFEMAERFIDEAELHAARAQDPNARRTIALQRLGLARAREDRDEHERLYAAAVAEFGGSGFADTFLQVLSGSGRARFGDSGIDELVAPCVDAALALHDRSLTCVVAEMAPASSLRAAAERLLEVMAPWTGQWMTWGLFGMVGEGPIARYQAVLASSLDRVEEAESRFRDAFEAVRRAGARALAARLGYEWARHLLGHDRASADAAALLEEARGTATDLGQTTLIELIDGLRSSGGGRAVSPDMVPTVPSFSLERDGDFWNCSCGDHSFTLKNTKGVRILARLVAAPGQEMHVLDLSGAAAADGARDMGDAGEILDAKAKAQYQRRVEELEAELAEAERFNDRGRAEKAREELEVIAGELARAFGLGGRERRSGAAAERARVNVQRRLRDAMRRIGRQSPEAGRHLEWALTTGMFCVYDPRTS